MTSEHCILQVAGACIHDCKRCRLRQRKMSLKNIDGRMLPDRTDVHGHSHLYDAYPIDATPQIPQLLAAGVSRFMVDGTLNTPGELARLVGRARRRSMPHKPNANLPLACRARPQAACS